MQSAVYNHNQYRNFVEWDIIPKITNYKFWQDGNKPIVLYSPKFTQQKLNYIHNNLVKERIVAEPQEYLFSSARNYAGLDGLLDVICYFD